MRGEALAMYDVPTPEEQARFLDYGLTLDQLGRPLHPWREQLPDLMEGRGRYWRWGPNFTVDPIVITRGHTPKILLIRRRDNGKWALPGGFIDPGEHPHAAARRELSEETGLILDTEEPQLCYQGPVLDERSRLHAWSETTALLLYSDSPAPVQAGDDAADARWVDLREIHTLGELHGSHTALIETALRQYSYPHDSHCYM